MPVGDGKKEKQPDSKTSSGDAHADQIFGAVYMNDLARETTFSKEKRIYPVGSIIVRERLLTESTKTPDVLTVMAKRAVGFNPAANDWEFLVVDADTMKIKKREKTGDCQQCHSSQKDRDFVLGTYVR